MIICISSFRKNSTLICSGRGECVCGNCECKPRRGNSEEKYSGKWCQCDDYSCPFHDNALCGGLLFLQGLFFFTVI